MWSTILYIGSPQLIRTRCHVLLLSDIGAKYGYEGKSVVEEVYHIDSDYPVHDSMVTSILYVSISARLSVSPVSTMDAARSGHINDNNV